jgi:hypothetical protein
MTTIKGLLIDPAKRTINEVELEEKNDSYLSDMRRLLGCSTVDVAREQIAGINLDIWVDDEGAFKSPEYFFHLPNYPEWLCGKGLVLGNDDLGNCISHGLTQEQIEAFAQSVKLGTRRKDI